MSRIVKHDAGDVLVGKEVLGDDLERAIAAVGMQHPAVSDELLV